MAEFSSFDQFGDSLKRLSSSTTYKDVQNVCALYQPAYTENNNSDAYSEQASNVVSLIEYLPEEHLTLPTFTAYTSKEAFIEAHSNFISLVNGVSDSENIHNIANLLSGFYLHVNNYHNAEHMLIVAKDALVFAQKYGAENDISEEESLLICKRLVIAALCHDAGNGRFPRAKIGSDEIDGVRTFLYLINDSEIDQNRSYLQNLGSENIIKIAAILMATVFHDRHADQTQLQKANYITEVTLLLTKAGYKSDPETFIMYMQNAEAQILKNADIADSLTPGRIIKNTFTVAYENLLKSAAFKGKSFFDSRTGFLSYLRGTFQSAIHGRETPLSLKAKEGQVLVNPMKCQHLHKLNINVSENDRELAILMIYDRAICEAMSKVIEINILSGHSDVLEKPLNELCPDLEEQFNNFAHVFSAPAYAFEIYKTLLTGEYRDQCLGELSNKQINSIFAARTSDVLNLLKYSNEHSSPEVQLLASAYNTLRPATWQARYIIETLRHVQNYKSENLLTWMNIDASNNPIIRMGENNSDAYILLGGEGRLVAKVNSQEVNSIRSPNIMGEMAALFGKRTADVFVEDGPVVLIKVGEKIVRDVITQPDLADELQRSVYQRLRSGEIVTKIHEQDLQQILNKLFTFNMTIADPEVSPRLQQAMVIEEIRQIAAQYAWNEISLKENEMLITKGTIPDFVYVITEGSLKVELSNNVIMRSLGEIIGEMSIIADNEMAKANVFATENSKVICLPRELFKACPESVRQLSAMRIHGDFN